VRNNRSSAVPTFPVAPVTTRRIRARMPYLGAAKP
jgi:hypothetical protein